MNKKIETIIKESNFYYTKKKDLHGNITFTIEIYRDKNLPPFAPTEGGWDAVSEWNDKCQTILNGKFSDFKKYLKDSLNVSFKFKVENLCSDYIVINLYYIKDSIKFNKKDLIIINKLKSFLELNESDFKKNKKNSIYLNYKLFMDSINNWCGGAWETPFLNRIHKKNFLNKINEIGFELKTPICNNIIEFKY